MAQDNNRFGLPTKYSPQQWAMIIGGVLLVVGGSMYYAQKANS